MYVKWNVKLLVAEDIKKEIKSFILVLRLVVHSRTLLVITLVVCLNCVMAAIKRQSLVNHVLRLSTVEVENKEVKETRALWPPSIHSMYICHFILVIFSACI